jgi:hypothetical protein
MVTLEKNWSDFKNLINSRYLSIQYEELSTKYNLYTADGIFIYHCVIIKDDTPNADQTDFENNYKAAANDAVEPHSEDRKTIVRSESRPLGHTTVFTCIGDDTDIGNGTPLQWDFSNSDDEVTAPEGYKRKRVEFKFLDAIHIKEGTIYFFDMKKGSYIDLYVVCPTGQYYLDNNGVPQQATEDTPVTHYVNHHFLFGDCPMGDELNTESCSAEIPNTYKFWIEVTVPDTDSTSHGSVSAEIYRSRTVIL